VRKLSARLATKEESVVCSCIVTKEESVVCSCIVLLCCYKFLLLLINIDLLVKPYSHLVYKL